MPTDEREAPAPPPHLQASTQDQGNPESLTTDESNAAVSSLTRKKLPRETGDDIGMGSPVPLSKEAVSVITNLRNMKVGEIKILCRWRSH